jgi:uncharacterized RDD family membrane protein YckC
VIDSIIVTAVLYAVGIGILALFMVTGDIVTRDNGDLSYDTLSKAVIALVLFALFLLYPILTVAVFAGTPGMRLLRLQVRRLDDGRRVSLATAAARTAVELLLYATVIGRCFDVLRITWTDHKQALHDKATGTVVVRQLWPGALPTKAG